MRSIKSRLTLSSLQGAKRSNDGSSGSHIRQIDLPAFAASLLGPDENGRKACRDNTAVRRGIANTCRKRTADQDGGGAHCDHIWTAGADCHVADTRRRDSTDQHRRTTWRQNRAADVRNNTRHHRTDMHVGNTGGWRHGSIHRRLSERFRFQTCDHYRLLKIVR